MSATPERAATGQAGVPRLAVFTSHPIQYQAPLFRELAAQGRVAPTVYFASRTGLDGAYDPHYGAALKWDTPVLDGYEHRFLDNVAKVPNVSTFRGLEVRDIDRVWAAERYDAALVLGWGTRAHVQASFAASRLGIPLFIRGESSLTMRPASSVKAAVRQLLWVPARRRIYGRLFRKVAGFLVIGSRNADFYRYHGVPDERMWWAPYCVDNAHFALAPDARAEARARIRAQLGVAESTTVFTSAAKLLPRKRPFDLLRAFSEIAHDADAHLLYLGGGPEREAVEAEVAARGLTGRVTISGFVNQGAIPDWYAASDCLVLPSDHMETWGLVVNEGMAAGLPAIVSDAVGCGPDLVKPGITGDRFPLGDSAALADRMRRMVDAGAAGRARMGAEARAHVAHYSIELNARAVADAVDASLTGERHPRSRLSASGA